MSSIARQTFVDVLRQSIHTGSIRIAAPHLDIVVGDVWGDRPPDVCLRVCHERFFRRVLAYGSLGMGESYMDGDFTIEHGTLHEFLTLLLRNRVEDKVAGNIALGAKLVLIRALSALRGRRSNIRRHYDIGDDLFETFLDRTLTYSCGYATTPEDKLEQLQWNKLDRICRKLRLQPGERLLDIGCGFGGLLLFAARHFCTVGTGVTISERHCQRGNAIAGSHALSDRVQIRFQDYRSVSGTFDKIVSVGMLEHVPRREYRTYFRTIARVLRPGGRGLVHAIGCNAPRNVHDPFIQKYIFPGSNQPKLSEIAGCLERCGLLILDVENIVRHYAYTVREWLRGFQENRSHALDPKRYDATFQRMWEYYLSCGIAAALASDSAVYQVLFTNDRTADLPLQRV